MPRPLASDTSPVFDALAPLVAEVSGLLKTPPSRAVWHASLCTLTHLLKQGLEAHVCALSALQLYLPSVINATLLFHRLCTVSECNCPLRPSAQEFFSRLMKCPPRLLFAADIVQCVTQDQTIIVKMIRNIKADFVSALHDHERIEFLRTWSQLYRFVATAYQRAHHSLESLPGASTSNIDANKQVATARGQCNAFLKIFQFFLERPPHEACIRTLGAIMDAWRVFLSCWDNNPLLFQKSSQKQDVFSSIVIALVPITECLSSAWDERLRCEAGLGLTQFLLQLIWQHDRTRALLLPTLALASAPSSSSSNSTSSGTNTSSSAAMLITELSSICSHILTDVGGTLQASLATGPVAQQHAMLPLHFVRILTDVFWPHTHCDDPSQLIHACSFGFCFTAASAAVTTAATATTAHLSTSSTSAASSVASSHVATVDLTSVFSRCGVWFASVSPSEAAAGRERLATLLDHTLGLVWNETIWPLLHMLQAGSKAGVVGMEQAHRMLLVRCLCAWRWKRHDSEGRTHTSAHSHRRIIEYVEVFLVSEWFGIYLNM
jgi:hypothetical protein